MHRSYILYWDDYTTNKHLECEFRIQQCGDYTMTMIDRDTGVLMFHRTVEFAWEWIESLKEVDWRLVKVDGHWCCNC